MSLNLNAIMSKLNKVLEKLLKKPPPADIRWTEICYIMDHFGYELKNGAGSRRKFYNRSKNLMVSCHEPHPQPTVKTYVIEIIVDHLTIAGFIDESI